MLTLSIFELWIIFQNYIWKAIQLSTRKVLLSSVQPVECDKGSQENTKEQPFKLIDVEGVPNLRGFGGYPSELFRPRKTRKRVIYRSAHPGGMTEAGLKQLKNLGIKHIIDLTSHDETTVQYNLTPERLEQEGIVRIHCPLEKKSFSIDELVSRYDTYKREGCQAVSWKYIELLNQGSETIRNILILLKENPDSAMLIHCSLGKDRTGVIFALLFLLMEVPESIIAKDYSLSTAGLASCVGNIEKYLRSKTNIDSVRQRAIEITTASEDTMTHTIQAFHTVYGGAHQYLRKHCGFTEIDITSLISILIDNSQTEST